MGTFKRSVWLRAILIVLFALASASFAKEKLVEFRIKDASNEEINRALIRLSKLPSPDERLSVVAHWFLGIPYKRDALGEGKGFDKDPLYTLSQVDCLTFIEQALGFVFSKSLADAKRFTVSLRYKNAQPQYSKRRHLVIAQWLPYVLQNRFLEYANRQWVGNSVVSETKRISHKTSCKGRWQEFCQRLGKELPEGEFNFNYVPISVAIKHCKQVPRGAVIFFVHTPRRYLPYQVFHAGVVVSTPKGQPALIHASKKKKKVVKTDFCRYLVSLPKRYQRWPVEGVILLKPVAHTK